MLHFFNGKIVGNILGYDWILKDPPPILQPLSQSKTVRIWTSVTKYNGHD
jgi:hypothetical protein